MKEQNSNYVAELSNKTGVSQSDVERLVAELKNNNFCMEKIARNSYGFFIKPDNPPIKKIASELRRMDSLLNVVIRQRLRGNVESKVFDDVVARASEIVDQITECNDYLKKELNKIRGKNKKQTKNNTNSADNKKTASTKKVENESKEEKSSEKEKSTEEKSAVVADPLGG